MTRKTLYCVLSIVLSAMTLCACQLSGETSDMVNGELGYTYMLNIKTENADFIFSGDFDYLLLSMDVDCDYKELHTEEQQALITDGKASYVHLSEVTGDNTLELPSILDLCCLYENKSLLYKTITNKETVDKITTNQTISLTKDVMYNFASCIRKWQKNNLSGLKKDNSDEYYKELCEAFDSIKENYPDLEYQLICSLQRKKDVNIELPDDYIPFDVIVEKGLSALEN